MLEHNVDFGEVSSFVNQPHNLLSHFLTFVFSIARSCLTKKKKKKKKVPIIKPNTWSHPTLLDEMRFILKTLRGAVSHRSDRFLCVCCWQTEESGHTLTPRGVKRMVTSQRWPVQVRHVAEVCKQWALVCLKRSVWLFGCGSDISQQRGHDQVELFGFAHACVWVNFHTDSKQK